MEKHSMQEVIRSACIKPFLIFSHPDKNLVRLRESKYSNIAAVTKRRQNQKIYDRMNMYSFIHREFILENFDGI